MAVNIKDSCPPWKNDPGKSFLTLNKVTCSVAHTVINGFCFPRKVHVTNMHLLWTQPNSVHLASVQVILYKNSVAVMSVALTTAQSSVLVEGDVSSSTEGEIEFLTTDEMEVCSIQAHGLTDGRLTPVIEYEQA